MPEMLRLAGFGRGGAARRATNTTEVIGGPFAEILDAARLGSDWAVGVLWRELQPPLLRYLRTGAREAAEDLASETWLEVARGLGRFQGGEEQFRAWLFTIARHRLVDWRRKVGRRRTEPVAWLPERPAAADTEEEALALVGTEEALALLAALPPDQAEVLVLRVAAGLDANQVAQVVGKKPGAVRVLQHRGLRRLALLLSGGEELPPAHRAAPKLFRKEV
jgi:RNA polymerase sigma-70 factor (ECF subfamily)